MKKAIVQLLAITTLGFALTACGGGEAAPPAPVIVAPPLPAPVTITGNWRGKAQTGAQSLLLDADLQQIGTAIAGSMTFCGSPCSSSTSLTGTLTGSNVNMLVSDSSGSFNIVGTLSGDNLTGSLNYGGLSLVVTLSRK